MPSEDKKILFIINPVSGVGQKDTIPTLVRNKFQSKAVDWKLTYTQHRNHGYEIAKQEKDNFNAIVAVGGDGSVNEIGSALIGSDCALGIIPCGSGNGLARHLGVPLKPDRAIDRIALLHTGKMDTGTVNGIPFLGTCGFGFDAHIAKKFDTFGQRGFFSYVRLVASEYNTYTPPSFKVKGKEINIAKKAIMCSIANASQFGNGFTISPNSSINDGTFELVLLDHFHPLKAPVITSKFFLGSIQSSTDFMCISFKDELNIEVEGADNYFHIDGEPMQGDGKFNIKMYPSSLNIL